MNKCLTTPRLFLCLSFACSTIVHANQGAEAATPPLSLREKLEWHDEARRTLTAPRTEPAHAEKHARRDRTALRTQP